ncbi:MAG TPA: DUF493 family protein [Cryomorphaceae bacterium]|nr:DUF493 family protein [Cryomorphaceae bacterium]
MKQWWWNKGFQKEGNTAEIPTFADMNEGELQRIKVALDANHNWPSVYMFKFIVPSDNEKIAKVEALFNSNTAELKMSQSKKGNYTSITAKEVMTNSEKVLECYREASKIEGLMAL